MALTQVTALGLPADVIEESKIADDGIDSEHYNDGSIDTAHIADDQVTLAKLAGLARGKIIYGDASGNPLGGDTNFVELYNETAWVTQPSLATGKRSGASTKQGTSSSTLFFGGRNGSSDQNKTEEFTGESTATSAIKTIDFD